MKLAFEHRFPAQFHKSYADWQRALQWIGLALKTLAIGTIFLHFKGP